MNHFIEIGRCAEGRVWVTIHSGSRQFGSKVAGYWQDVAAKKSTEKRHVGMIKNVIRIKETFHRSKWSKEITKAREKYVTVTKGLEYLEDEDMFGYLIDMVFTQTYAEESRKLMKELVIDALTLPRNRSGYDYIPYCKMYDYEHIACSHNYIDFKDFIIRKGAISAYKDELMIIPFNMEDGTLICKGKGNPEWNYSAPHGAGRPMSRTDAKRKAKKEGYLQKAKVRMEEKGMFASKLPADELRESYKDPKMIEDAIGPTAEIIRKIIPIIAMKD